MSTPAGASSAAFGAIDQKKGPNTTHSIQPSGTRHKRKKKREKKRTQHTANYPKNRPITTTAFPCTQHSTRARPKHFACPPVKKRTIYLPEVAVGAGDLLDASFGDDLLAGGEGRRRLRLLRRPREEAEPFAAPGRVSHPGQGQKAGRLFRYGAPRGLFVVFVGWFAHSFRFPPDGGDDADGVS